MIFMMVPWDKTWRDWNPQDLSVWIVQHSILGENILTFLTGNQDQPSFHFPTMEGLEASKVDFFYRLRFLENMFDGKRSRLAGGSIAWNRWIVPPSQKKTCRAIESCEIMGSAMPKKNRLEPEHVATCWSSSSSSSFYTNCNISLTWIKAIWGWFPLLTMIPSEVAVSSL